MRNPDRVWCVMDVNAAWILASMLSTNIYPPCSGFRHKGYLYLNDSPPEYWAEEYGVIKESTGQQVAAFIFSQCDPEEVLKYIRAISAGIYDNFAQDSGIDLSAQIQALEQHGKCPLCS